MQVQDITHIWLRVYQTLPLEHAIALDLHFSHGLTIDKVAKTLETDTATVSKYIRNSIKQLKEDPQLKDIWAQLEG